jgi:hypothetical protein
LRDVRIASPITVAMNKTGFAADANAIPSKTHLSFGA